jgi:hypothetical protein
MLASSKESGSADERVNQRGIPSSGATSVYLEKSEKNEPNQGRYVEKSIRVRIELERSELFYFFSFFEISAIKRGLSSARTLSTMLESSALSASGSAA